jgi:plasmid maintenance system antidote protein VapI
LGQLIDSIWHRLPEGHHLHKLDPTAMGCPHVDLLGFGQAVIDDCRSHGGIVDTKLEGPDYNIWLRFVGAWALFQRKTPMTRNVAAQILKIDPSNLTNFINGKRALTANALTGFAELFGIEAFDLKPDLGANFARNAEQKVAEKLICVESKINLLKADVQLLIDQGAPLGALLTRIDDIKLSVSA